MGMPTTLRGASSYSSLQMALKDGETPIVIGLAADSGCGKSTFMRRVTSTFGGDQCGPLGGGFGNGSWETNTLVSDMATVICLDDYHLNDREGRKVSGLTALNTAEQKFDLMFEHVQALKNGKSVMKPIYNHVNGTLDTPEKIEPTPVIIIEGLHPFVDERVRELIDFSLYLDISPDVKLNWKIQRDMEERGHPSSPSWRLSKPVSLTSMPTLNPRRRLPTMSSRCCPRILTPRTKRRSRFALSRRRELPTSTPPTFSMRALTSRGLLPPTSFPPRHLE